MFYCCKCTPNQYCKRLVTQVFTDTELEQRFFQIDFKTFLIAYKTKHHVTLNGWHEHLCALYRDYRGWISDHTGTEVFLDMGVFEQDHIREWFRDYIKIVPPGTRTRLRDESIERVRVLATIMRAYHPIAGNLWGVRANDNRPATKKFITGADTSTE